MSTLKVGAIQSATGNAAINIDNAGRITRPNQPVFFAKNGGNATLTQADSGYRKLTTEGTWDTPDVNRGNVFSAGVFTAPVAGIYYIDASITYSGAATDASDGWGIALFKNGTGITHAEIAYVEGVTSGNEGHSKVSMYFDLAQNDTIEMGFVGTNESINFNYWYMGGHLVA